jgi:hypothetical protein
LNKNEKAFELRVLILDLRRTFRPLAENIEHFEQCSASKECLSRQPDVANLMIRLADSMRDSLLSSMTALNAVFERSPKKWDNLWKSARKGKFPYERLEQWDWEAVSDQEDAIEWLLYGEDTADLDWTFSKLEWELLSDEKAWQYGKRMSQVLPLLTLLKHQIEKKLELLEQILHGNFCVDCSVKCLNEIELTAIARDPNDIRATKIS